MSAAEISRLFKEQKLVCHAFSPDCNYIAVSLKENSQINIYEVNPQIPSDMNKWKLAWSIRDQSLTVSAIDWSVQNQILSCSFDRSVYVYRHNPQFNQWMKDLVILHNDRAVLTGKWSPNGMKFAVGTSCHRVYVGHLEQKNNWWQGEKIAGCKSSVVQVSWHPSGRVLAFGSTDYTVQLVTAVIQDDKNQPILSIENDSYSGVYQNVTTFGEILFKLANTNGWVETLAFSPSGMKLAFAVHNGLVQYLELSDEKVHHEGDNKQIYPPSLPITQMIYIDENRLIVSGYDKKPALMSNENGWKWEGFTEKPLATGVGSIQSRVSVLAGTFQQRGVQADDKNSHLSAIVSMNAVPQSTQTYSTNDVNGVINFWKV